MYKNGISISLNNITSLFNFQFNYIHQFFFNLFQGNIIKLCLVQILYNLYQQPLNRKRNFFIISLKGIIIYSLSVVFNPLRTDNIHSFSAIKSVRKTSMIHLWESHYKFAGTLFSSIYRNICSCGFNGTKLQI